MAKKQKTGDRKQNPPARKFRFPRIIPALIITAVVGVIFTIAGFAFGASQESHDSFCASCHTQPESTFYQRSQGASPVDLASYHTSQSAGCIDCHSGEGAPGRIQAEMLGASNALKWFSGTAVQPAVLAVPIADQNCLKCHQNVPLMLFMPKEQMTAPGTSGGAQRLTNGHWHQFLSRWQANDPNAGGCASCHSGHASDVNLQNGFLNDQTVLTTCSACHNVLRREGGG